MTLDQSNLTTGGIVPTQFVTCVLPTPAAPTLTPVVFLLDTTPTPVPIRG